MIKKKKILIVDDEPDILRTTQYSLEDAGYEVYAAGDGDQALSKIKEVRPDLILMDLILPGQSGFQVAQKIKSMPEYKDIPIIALSCKTEQPSKSAAAKSGILEYVEKPIDLDRLLFHISDAIAD